MIQILASIVEWIALAGLSLLGVDYKQTAQCDTAESAYETIEFIVIADDDIWLAPEHEGIDDVGVCDDSGVPEFIAEPGSTPIFTEI